MVGWRGVVWGGVGEGQSMPEREREKAVLKYEHPILQAVTQHRGTQKPALRRSSMMRMPRQCVL